MTVWILQHVRAPNQDDEDVKLIGVYSTRVAGEDAVLRLKGLQGFNHPDGEFYLEPYQVDKDHWTEGFGS